MNAGCAISKSRTVAESRAVRGMRIGVYDFQAVLGLKHGPDLSVATYARRVVAMPLRVEGGERNVFPGKPVKSTVAGQATGRAGGLCSLLGVPPLKCGCSMQKECMHHDVPFPRLCIPARKLSRRFSIHHWPVGHPLSCISGVMGSPTPSLPPRNMPALFP